MYTNNYIYIYIYSFEKRKEGYITNFFFPLVFSSICNVITITHLEAMISHSNFEKHVIKNEIHTIKVYLYPSQSLF